MLQDRESKSAEAEDLCTVIGKGFEERKFQNLNKHVKTLKQLAYRDGLNSDIISTIVDWVVNHQPKPRLMSALIQCLVPNELVSAVVVRKLVFFAGCNACPISCKNTILRWALLVFHYVNKVTDLAPLKVTAAVLMQYETLAPWCCHLLALLFTRLGDVLLSDVHELLRLRRRMPSSQSYITGLLVVYKTYLPTQVNVGLSTTRKVYFKHPGKPWSQAIARAQRAGQRTAFNTGLLRTTAPLPPKRRRILPPPTSELHSLPVATTNAPKRIPAVHLDTFADLWQSFGKLELPQQMASLLRGPLLRHVLIAHPDPDLRDRLSFWIGFNLIEHLVTCPHESEEIKEEFLDQVLEFEDLIEESIPMVPLFLNIYLARWDGIQFRLQIIGLLSRLPLFAFQAYPRLLDSLQKLFLQADEETQVQLALGLGSLIQHLTTIEFPRVVEQQKRHCERSLQVSPDVLSVFSSRPVVGQPMGLPRKLCRWLSKTLLEQALQARPRSLPLLHTTQQLMLQLMSSDQEGPPLPAIAGLGFHSALFSLSPVLVNSAANLALVYKHQWSLELHQTDAELFDKCVTQVNELLSEAVSSLFFHRYRSCVRLIGTEASMTGRFFLRRHPALQALFNQNGERFTLGDMSVGQQLLLMEETLRQVGYNSIAQLKQLLTKSSDSRSRLRSSS